MVMSCIRPSPDGARSPVDRVIPDGLPGEAEILGRAGGENFPVALRVLPRTVRTHLLAVYGYARLVDQLGDDYAGDRLAALDWVEAEVDRALAGSDGTTLHPLVVRAVATVVEVGADPELLRDLVEANRRDQRITRYATFDDLVEYCRYSANPVGRLVLAIFSVATPERQALSDAVCTALQLAEHLQDLAEDAEAGRVYLPAEDLDRFGVSAASIRGPGPASPAQRALIAFEVARARRLLDEGAALVDGLRGWARLAVAAFVAGGAAALDAVADAGFDPLPGTPRPRPTKVATGLVRTLAGRRSAGQRSAGQKSAGT
jgi:squalene synthase HpnC